MLNMEIGMEIRKKENIVIIDLPIRLINVSEFSDVLIDTLENSTNHIVLNFAKVDHVNSAFVSSIIHAMRFLENTERKIKLCSLNKKIKEILAIVNLDKSLDIAQNEDDALWDILQSQEDPTPV